MRILDENTLDSRIEAVENPSAVIETLESNKIPFSTPNSSDYESLRLPYNVRLQPKPAIIVIPETPQQVSEAIRAAAQSGIKVQARSGGHSYASFSVGGQDGSMIIDLREFHDVEVLEQFTDPETGEVLKGVVAKVGGGVRLGNMARKIYEQGKRALPHGTGSAVGIGGHATLGGYGYVSRAWGLALDRIVAMDVVLANGRIVHASAKENEDVFWAVRGAAHSFAVVLNFYMRTEEAPREVTYVEIEWDGMYDNKDRFADTFLGIQQLVTDGQVVDARLSFGVRIDGGSYKVTGGFIGSAEELKKKIMPFMLQNVPSPSSTTIKSLQWTEFLEKCSDEGTLDVGTDEHKSFFGTSLTVPESAGLTKPALEAFFDTITTPPLPEKYFVIINLHGGPKSAVNSKDTSFSAYADRDSLWTFQIRADNDTAECRDFVKSVRETIIQAQPGTHFGASLSYIDASLSREEAWEIYYADEDVLKTLRSIKLKMDPSEVFWNPHAIISEQRN